MVRAAWVLAAGLLVLLAAHFVAPDGTWPLLVLNQFSPWVYALAWPVALGAVLARRWRLVVAIILPLVWHLALVIPPWLPRTPPVGCGQSLTVLSANLLMVHPSPPALAQEVFDTGAELVILQELSPRWQTQLDGMGFYEAWPEGWQVVREDSFGSGIWSNVPLDSAEEWELSGLPQTRAALTWEGRPLTVLNVHTLPPRTSEYTVEHREALALLAAELKERAAQGESFLVAGDLNASPYSRFFSDIAGVADDAWDLAGWGFGFTWPNGIFPLPPTRLDHVVVSRDLTVRSIAVGTGEGSDHRPLRVEVAWRCR